jgi:hypothetical protein
MKATISAGVSLSRPGSSWGLARKVHYIGVAGRCARGEAALFSQVHAKHFEQQFGLCRSWHDRWDGNNAETVLVVHQRENAFGRKTQRVVGLAAGDKELLDPSRGEIADVDASGLHPPVHMHYHLQSVGNRTATISHGFELRAEPGYIWDERTDDLY